jgi:hypothetical protein
VTSNTSITNLGNIPLGFTQTGAFTGYLWYSYSAS